MATTYYFSQIGDNGLTLAAAKTWDAPLLAENFDVMKISTFGTPEELEAAKAMFVQIQEDLGVEAAMNLAERYAARNGFLNPFREDGRIFTHSEGPVDHFRTIRDRELFTAQLRDIIHGQVVKTEELEQRIAELDNTDYCACCGRELGVVTCCKWCE